MAQVSGTFTVVCFTEVVKLQIMTELGLIRHSALQHFEQARRRARRERISARLTGRERHLLPFDAIRAQLRQKNPLYGGLRPVPLERIAGSVGRYAEFTRRFLPLNDSFRERWVRIEALCVTEGWPPIEVYEIGDVYFVKDGNHRVAVARQMGIKSIEGRVWTFPEDLILDPEDSLDDVLIQLGERRFMQETGLDQLDPQHTIRFTTPGRYTELLVQIADLREKLSDIDGREMPYDEAVAAWYEMTYLPTLQIIHDAQLLQQFPGRTEADLFVWLSVHRDRLSDHYGQHDNLMQLAAALADRYGQGSVRRLAGRVRRLLGQEAAAPLAIPGTDAADEE